MTALVDVAVGVLTSPDGRVLLTCRHPSVTPEIDRMFQLPGGKVEPGECPEAALVREWREELSAEITVGDLVHVFIFYASWVSGPVRIWAFEVHLDPNSPIQLTDAGGTELIWGSLREWAAHPPRPCLASTQPVLQSYCAFNTGRGRI